MLLRLQLLTAPTCEVLGNSWEIRAVGVTPDGGGYPLTDGWPKGGRPEAQSRTPGNPTSALRCRIAGTVPGSAGSLWPASPYRVDDGFGDSQLCAG